MSADLAKSLDELARSLCAFEKVDGSGFRRKARVLQAMWREEMGYPMGWREGRSGRIPMGSRLEMPWARETLANFLTETIRNTVRAEVLDPNASRAKLFAKPRLFNDLLSSQPLCFNLFGELKHDLALASAVIAGLTSGRFAKVTGIEFEYSPGPGDPRYLGDHSAFDVFLRCVDSDGEPGFVGIEVKYHENLKGAASGHKARYDEVADLMGCFAEDRSALRSSPLQQIWRDHLLAGITRIEGGYRDGMFVVLYPEQNPHVSNAVAEYARRLTDQNSFAAWTMEDFVAALRRHSTAAWIDAFDDRYLRFEKVDGRIRGARVVDT